MRLIVVLSMAVNLLIVGPFEVGIPVLAYTRLPEGSAAFGLDGLGLWSWLADRLGCAPRHCLRHGRRYSASLALGTIAVAGVLLAGMSVVYATLPALVLALLIGIRLGFSNLLTITWIQRRVPGDVDGPGDERADVRLARAGASLDDVRRRVRDRSTCPGLLIVGGLGMAVLVLASLLVGPIRHMG